MISEASPMHMARDLVVRHSDIGFIRGYIISYFGRDVPLPSREKIEALRADYLARVAAAKDGSRAVLSENKLRERNRRKDNERNAARRKVA